MKDDFAEEQGQLAHVIQHAKAELDSVELAKQAPAPNRSAARALLRSLNNTKATLESALEQLYFGRIDYAHLEEGLSESALQAQIIYIGAHHIDGTNVHSWTAPVAKLWYTEDRGYRAPSGYKPVRMDLKRYLKIRDNELVEINDIFRRLLPGPDLGKSHLADALSSAGRKDGHLQVIVETIEPEQYESIANQDDRTLIIQGSAGSGKSEIGLHRIAYLLSPFSNIETRDRPTPGTTLFIGPSQSFLEYASDVLPTLGVQSSVRQRTFRGWLEEHRTFRRRPRSEIWNELLNRGQMGKFNEEIERFKGSLAMSDALDRRVRRLTAEVRRACRRLPTRVELPAGRHVEIGQREVRSILETTLSAPPEGFRLNDRRQVFVRSVASVILARSENGRRVSREDADRRRRTTLRAVSDWCDKAWPRFDVRQEYAASLRDSEVLLSVAQGNLSEDNIQALAKSAERMSVAGFFDSDEGALTYLDHLLNGTIEQRYRHIVVDEAQDISPIEFKLLSLASTNRWFTILGDTAQRLTPYRGIHRWRSLDRVLGRTDITVQHARTSYRSNKHITRFNNRILRLFESTLPAPIPFDREGSRVEYHRHANMHAMQRVVVDDLDRIRSQPNMSGARIAILARDTRNLRRFEEYCEVLGRDDVVRIGQDHYVDSRTVLARIPDVRGLEYDAVIVLGVNEAFADTLFNQKLLYQATTRARHYLAIH